MSATAAAARASPSATIWCASACAWRTSAAHCTAAAARSASAWAPARRIACAAASRTRAASSRARAHCDCDCSTTAAASAATHRSMSFRANSTARSPSAVRPIPSSEAVGDDGAAAAVEAMAGSAGGEALRALQSRARLVRPPVPAGGGGAPRAAGLAGG